MENHSAVRSQPHFTGGSSPSSPSAQVPLHPVHASCTLYRQIGLLGIHRAVPGGWEVCPQVAQSKASKPPSSVRQHPNKSLQMYGVSI